MKLLTFIAAALLCVVAAFGASAAPSPAPLNGVKILNTAISAVESFGIYSKMIDYMRRDGLGVFPSIAARLALRQRMTILLPTNAVFDAYVRTAGKKITALTPVQARDTIGIHILRGGVTVGAALAFPLDTLVFTSVVIPVDKLNKQFRIRKSGFVRGKPAFNFVSSQLLGPNPFIIEKTLYNNGFITIVQVNQFLRWNIYLRS